MATPINLESRGLDEAIAMLQRGEQRLSDLRPVLRITAEQFKTLIDESFLQGRSPDGTPWPALSPEYAKRKRQMGLSPRILVRRGARGLMGATHASAKRDGITVGTAPTAPHGRVHHYGPLKARRRDGRKNGLKRRAFLPFNGAPGQEKLMANSPRVQAIRAEMEERLREYIFGE